MKVTSVPVKFVLNGEVRRVRVSFPFELKDLQEVVLQLFSSCARLIASGSFKLYTVNSDGTKSFELKGTKEISLLTERARNSVTKLLVEPTSEGKIRILSYSSSSLYDWMRESPLKVEEVEPSNDTVVTEKSFMCQKSNTDFSNSDLYSWMFKNAQEKHPHSQISCENLTVSSTLGDWMSVAKARLACEDAHFSTSSKSLYSWMEKVTASKVAFRVKKSNIDYPNSFSFENLVSSKAETTAFFNKCSDSPKKITPEYPSASPVSLRKQRCSPEYPSSSPILDASEFGSYTISPLLSRKVALEYTTSPSLSPNFPKRVINEYPSKRFAVFNDAEMGDQDVSLNSNENSSLYSFMYKFENSFQPKSRKRQTESLGIEEEIFGFSAKRVTLEDSPSVVTAKTSLYGIWKVENKGTQTWPQGSKLILQATPGLLSGHFEFPLPSLSPGEETIVSVDFLAPCKEGKYVAFWEFDGNGVRSPCKTPCLDIEVLPQLLNWDMQGIKPLLKSQECDLSSPALNGVVI